MVQACQVQNLDDWMRRVLPWPADYVGPMIVPPFRAVLGLQSRDSHFFELPALGSSGASMSIYLDFISYSI